MTTFSHINGVDPGGGVIFFFWCFTTCGLLRLFVTTDPSKKCKAWFLIDCGSQRLKVRTKADFQEINCFTRADFQVVCFDKPRFQVISWRKHSSNFLKVRFSEYFLSKQADFQVISCEEEDFQVVSGSTCSSHLWRRFSSNLSKNSSSPIFLNRFASHIFKSNCLSNFSKTNSKSFLEACF